ncbi:uncharacterized protein [Vicugna pacos]|uniref:Uncharacterized protein n=1 Tax=Vicugna pacos TaxID=30538 RepID=A0ABM5E9Z4_VICPA
MEQDVEVRSDSLRAPNNTAFRTAAPAASVTSVFPGACWLQPPEEAPARPGPRRLSGNQETGSPASPDSRPPARLPHASRTPRAPCLPAAHAASGGSLAPGSQQAPANPGVRFLQETAGSRDLRLLHGPKSPESDACRPRGPVPLAWTRWRPQRQASAGSREPAILRDWSHNCACARGSSSPKQLPSPPEAFSRMHPAWNAKQKQPILQWSSLMRLCFKTYHITSLHKDYKKPPMETEEIHDSAAILIRGRLCVRGGEARGRNRSFLTWIKTSNGARRAVLCKPQNQRPELPKLNSRKLKNEDSLSSFTADQSTTT